MNKRFDMDYPKDIPLKPCPFCGKPVKVRMTGSGLDADCIIACRNKDCKIRVFITGELEKIVPAWNARPTSL